MKNLYIYIAVLLVKFSFFWGLPGDLMLSGDSMY